MRYSWAARPIIWPVSALDHRVFHLSIARLNLSSSVWLHCGVWVQRCYESLLMKALVQRVTHAKVEVDGAVVGKIDAGLLVLLGVAKGDTASDADFLAKKIAGLRIFSDSAGKMNLSLKETGGALLAVSQFTLYGDCSKGRRPGFDLAAPGDQARALYEQFVAALRREGVRVETGVFQAHMAVSLVNDGPVTLIVESPSQKEPK